MSDKDSAFSAEEQRQFDQMQGSDAGGEAPPPSAKEPAAGKSQAEIEKPAKAEKGDGEREQRTVPIHALHEERQRRQEFQREVEELRRWRQEREAAEAKAKEPALPNPEQDPYGYLRAQIDRLSNGQEAERKQREQAAQRTQQEAAARQIMDRGASLERDFAEKNKDYPEALAFLTNARAEELRDMFPTATDEQIGKMVEQDAMGALFLSLRQNRNPAELLYQQAKRRGWQPKAKEQEQESEAKEKIERLQKGQEQAGGLGGAKGSAPPATSIEQALRLSDEEFAKRFGAGNEEAWQKLAGAA